LQDQEPRYGGRWPARGGTRPTGLRGHNVLRADRTHTEVSVIDVPEPAPRQSCRPLLGCRAVRQDVSEEDVQYAYTSRNARRVPKRIVSVPWSSPSLLGLRQRGGNDDRSLQCSSDCSRAAQFSVFCHRHYCRHRGEYADPNSSGNAQFPPYDFSRPALVRLTRALTAGRPAFLRIGGTQADHTYYDLSGAATPTPPPNYEHVLTRGQWDAANRFAQSLGLCVFFGINAGSGPRDAGYRWVPDNARALLEYTKAQGYPLRALEFGNEPNVLVGTRGAPASYKAPSYARDIEFFDRLRSEIVPDVMFVGPGSLLTPGDPEGERPILLGDQHLVLGPEARDVLPLIGDVYDAINYHFYPGFSDRCPYTPKVPQDVLADAWLDIHLVSYRYMAALRDRFSPGKPL